MQKTNAPSYAEQVFGDPAYGVFRPGDYFRVAAMLRLQGMVPSERWLMENAPTLAPIQDWKRPIRMWVERQQAFAAKPIIKAMAESPERQALLELVDEMLELDEPTTAMEQHLLKLESGWRRFSSVPDAIKMRLRHIRGKLDPRPSDPIVPLNLAHVDELMNKVCEEWDKVIFPEGFAAFSADLGDDIELEAKRLLRLVTVFSSPALWQNTRLVNELGWDFRLSVLMMINFTSRSVAWALDVTRAYANPMRFVNQGLHPAWSRKTYGPHAMMELFAVGEFEAVAEAIMTGLAEIGPIDEWPEDVAASVSALVGLTGISGDQIRELDKHVPFAGAPQWLLTFVKHAYLDFLWGTNRLGSTSVEALTSRPTKQLDINALIDDAYMHGAFWPERKGLARLLEEEYQHPGGSFGYSSPADRVPSDWKLVSCSPASWWSRFVNGQTDELIALGRLLGSIMWSDDDVALDQSDAIDAIPFKAASAIVTFIRPRNQKWLPNRSKYQLGRFDGDHYYLRTRTIRTEAPLAFPAAMKSPGEPLSGMDDELWRELVDSTAAARAMYFQPS